MRTTLVIADDLVEDARAASGLDRISDVVREGLRALIAKEARAQLAAMGGRDPKAETAPRRRSPPAASSKKARR